MVATSSWTPALRLRLVVHLARVLLESRTLGSDASASEKGQGIPVSMQTGPAAWWQHHRGARVASCAFLRQRLGNDGRLGWFATRIGAASCSTIHSEGGTCVHRAKGCWERQTLSGECGSSSRARERAARAGRVDGNVGPVTRGRSRGCWFSRQPPRRWQRLLEVDAGCLYSAMPPSSDLGHREAAEQVRVL